MNVAVVIAYVDRGCPYRRAALDFVRGWYVGGGLEGVVVGEEPFSRAAAINRGVEATTADVIVQSDPDSIVTSWAVLREAIAMAGAVDGLVTPFSRYLYLERGPSLDIIAGHRAPDLTDEHDAEDHGANGIGNVAVFSRRTWERAGGFDERFGTWGGDDRAFAFASELAGPNRRLEGTMVHLWHPRLPESIEGHPEHERSMELGRAWRAAAAGGREVLEAYVAALR